MKIKGITEKTLRNIIDVVSLEMYDGNIKFKREPEQKGNFLHFTVTVNKAADPGGRRSHTGRRVAAACWHVHRDIMREIFDANPDAILVTAVVRYEGRDDFERKYRATGEQNIGSMAQPLYYINACDCNA